MVTLAGTPSTTSERLLFPASLVVLLTVWEVLGKLKPRVLSYPSEVVRSAYELVIIENELLPAVKVTLEGLAYGFALAAVAGVVLGFAMGRSRLVEIILYPYAMALYATPRIALVPLLVLWFGIDLKLRVVVVILSSVFPVMINTYNGVRHVDRAYLETARAFAATPRQVLRTVVAPAAVPYIFAGLRVGTIRALIGVVVAEMTASVVGTGQLIIQLGSFFQTGRLLVPIMTLGVLGLLLSRGMRAAQLRVAPWAAMKGQQ